MKLDGGHFAPEHGQGQDPQPQLRGGIIVIPQRKIRHHLIDSMISWNNLSVLIICPHPPFVQGMERVF